jgi:GNAT superfamily N-acetyltransferase
MTTTIREATRDDLDDLQRIRALVRENRLSYRIPDERVLAALEARGRGWVAEHDGEAVGFSIADLEDGSIWALFLLPEWEGRGLGRALLERAVAWLEREGCPRVWLSTAPGTRAEGFYARLGWERVGLTEHGEVRFELPLAPRAGRVRR